MKAVIVEIKGKFVAALSEDGTFTQMKNDHYAVGQKIEVNALKVARPKMAARLSALAACCALVCGLGVGAYAYVAPAYYVSMDVNPSVEYTLNTFDQVLSAQAANEDGAKILQGINLKTFQHKSIDEAIRLTLAEITREGYFDGPIDGGIVLATSGKKASAVDQLAARLKELVTAQCAENRKTVSVESITVDKLQREQAKVLGVTPGKMILVQKLLAENPAMDTSTAEDWLKRPVRDIMREMERLEDLAEDAEDAKKDAAEAAEDAKKDAAEAAEDAEKDAAEAAEDAKKDAAEAAEDAKNDAEDAAEADEEDDRPAAPGTQAPPLNHTKPSKPADTADGPDVEKQPDASDEGDVPESADPPEEPSDLPDATPDGEESDPPKTDDLPDSPEPADPPDPPDPTETSADDAADSSAEADAVAP